MKESFLTIQHNQKANYGQWPNFLVINFVHFQKFGTYYKKRLAPITTNQMT